MRKILLAAASTVLIFIATSTFAADFKVGVVDMQKVLQNDPKVQAVEDKLKKQFSPQQDKLVASQKQLNDEIAKLNRDAAVMKDADKKAQEQKIRDDAKKFQDSQADFQKQFMLAREDALQTVLKDVEAIVASISKDKGLNMVVVKASVVYSDADLDITDQVVKQIQAKK